MPAQADTAPGIEPGAPKIMTIPVKDLYRDPLANPREPSEAWIEARSGRRYKRHMIGVLQVSLRDGSDGRRRGPAVMDGWHRRMLVCRNEGPDAEVECEVFQDLPLEDEADIFLGRNDSRKVHAVPRFKARVTAKEIIPVQVWEIVEKAGFRIEEQRGPGILVCVAALERIHVRDKAKCGTVRRPQALARTLEALSSAYSPADPRFYARNKAATHVAVVGGIGHLYTFWGDAANPTRMAKVLAEWDGTADGLLANANGAQKVTPGINTDWKAVAYLVALAYNKDLRARALPVPFR